MELINTIQERYSLRRFADKAIEEEKLKTILDAGRLAPTARNQQRNKTIVVRDPALKAKMVDACCGQKFVGNAAAILVVCADEDRDMTCGRSARTVDCCIALSFMILQAAEFGIQGCWLGAFETDKVKALLGIPEEFIVTAVFPMGYAEQDDGVRREKKPLEEFVCWDKF